MGYRGSSLRGLTELATRRWRQTEKRYLDDEKPESIDFDDELSGRITRNLCFCSARRGHKRCLWRLERIPSSDTTGREFQSTKEEVTGEVAAREKTTAQNKRLEALFSADSDENNGNFVQYKCITNLTMK